MQLQNKRPESLLDVKMHYCPGCGHGTIHRIIAEVMDELGIRNRTIGVAPVGCAVFADTYFNCDMIQGPHGRGPAEATGRLRDRDSQHSQHQAGTDPKKTFSQHDFRATL